MRTSVSVPQAFLVHSREHLQLAGRVLGAGGEEDVVVRRDELQRPDLGVDGVADRRAVAHVADDADHHRLARSDVERAGAEIEDHVLREVRVALGSGNDVTACVRQREIVDPHLGKRGGQPVETGAALIRRLGDAELRQHVARAFAGQPVVKEGIDRRRHQEQRCFDVNIKEHVVETQQVRGAVKLVRHRRLEDADCHQLIAPVARIREQLEPLAVELLRNGKDLTEVGASTAGFQVKDVPVEIDDFIRRREPVNADHAHAVHAERGVYVNRVQDEVLFQGFDLDFGNEGVIGRKNDAGRPRIGLGALEIRGRFQPRNQSEEGLLERHEVRPPAFSATRGCDEEKSTNERNDQRE